MIPGLFWTQEESSKDKEAYEVRREQWRRIVTECINECYNSGMSKKWCRQNTINIKVIYYWQRKLGLNIDSVPPLAPKTPAGRVHDVSVHFP